MAVVVGWDGCLRPSVFQKDALTAEAPAVVCDCDEERRGVPCPCADEEFQEGVPAAKPHGADAEGVGLAEGAFLQFRKCPVLRTHSESPEQLEFCLLAAAGAVAAHGHPKNPRRTAASLRLQHRVQYAPPDAVEVTSSPQPFVWKGVLDAPVLGAAALQEKRHLRDAATAAELPYNVEISVGWTTYNSRSEPLSQAVERADIEMYERKRSKGIHR